MEYPKIGEEAQGGPSDGGGGRRDTDKGNVNILVYIVCHCYFCGTEGKTSCQRLTRATNTHTADSELPATEFCGKIIIFSLDMEYPKIETQTRVNFF